MNEQQERSWLSVLVLGRNPKRTLVRCLVLVVTCVIVSRFMLLPIRIQGGSMLPTYKENGINFINRLAYLRHEPQRGDVVGIRLAGTSIMYLKRIVALPEETIAFRNGHILINGRLLNEPYLKLSCDWDIPPQTLGPHEYFFVGDNRSMPPRDHTMGVGDRNRIVGKILL